MTAEEWIMMNMLTGEIKSLDEIEQPQHKPRRNDVIFDAGIKLWGYTGQPLTKSLRGSCNKSLSEIKGYERERSKDTMPEAIADLIIGFRAWFIRYRRERFNEICTRCPYPMETAKLWPMYRLCDVSNVAQDWLKVINKSNTE